MPAGREAEATSFYRDLLGLPLASKPEHLQARGGCWFETDEVRVHLGIESDFRPAKKAHPALLVEGLDSFVEELERQGVPVIVDEPLAGHRRIYTEDPFGNRLELIESD
jgi:catechol 2,3-dioxygenase-like lactoylglutathione lyase family enzyme